MSSKSEEMQKSDKALWAARVCYWCASPILDEGAIECPECGSMDLDERHTRPIRRVPKEAPALTFPWSEVRFELGGTCILSGNRGSGKTTICNALKPTKILTSEQEPGQVASIWYRVNKEPAPYIHRVTCWEDVNADTVDIDKDDFVVIDSISQMGSHQQSVEIAKMIIRRIRQAQARAVFIAQYTKDGDMLGPNELNHIVDIVAGIPVDKLGMRRLSVSKNRFDNLTSTYFEIGGFGVRRPSFENAYSVEGPAGDYSLLMYPFKGALFNGIFEAMENAKLPVDGLACAAVGSSSYRRGFAEPPDINMRKFFAEKHGLTWVSVEQITAWLADPEGARVELDDIYRRRQIS